MRKFTAFASGLLLGLFWAGAANAQEILPIDPDAVIHLSDECSDGVDNDGDGLADFPDDPDCVDAEDEAERTPTPVRRRGRLFRPLRLPEHEGDHRVWVLDLSRDGRVKVGALTASIPGWGYQSLASIVWRGNRPQIIEDLRPLPPDVEYPPQTGAFAVSADGRWVAGTHGEWFGPPNAYLWRDGQLTDLEQPPNPELPGQLADTWPFSISDAGVIVGRAYTRPARWDEQGFAWLDPGPDGSSIFASAHAITPDGKTTVGAGFVQLADLPPHRASIEFPHRWSGSDVRGSPLTDVPQRGHASDVSDDGGTIVGAVEGLLEGAYVVPGFIHNESGVTYVAGTGFAPPATYHRWRVSGDGSLVFGWVVGVGPVLVSGGQVRTLADLLVNEYGLDLEGWDLVLPHSRSGLVALSGDGRTLITHLGNAEGAIVPVEIRLPPACSDGLDNDGDGMVDTDDGGCRSARDRSEDSLPWSRRR